MHILILGATGFVGSQLSQHLMHQGHSIRASTRRPLRSASPQLDYVFWNGHDVDVLAAALDSIDVVINLQGENIGSQRWNAQRKHEILQSRVQAGQSLCAALQQRHAAQLSLPHTVLQTSASGYYGLWQDAATAPFCTEDSPAGTGFLAEVCTAWEASIAPVTALGIRLCITRFSPIIGKTVSGAVGGFVAQMLPPFRYFLGGALGSGRQPVSWVHLYDVVHSIQFLIEHPELHGIVNISAPELISMRHFAQAVGQAYHRPSWLPVPAFLLSLALGEMANELILAGQQAQPMRLLEAGYTFHFTTAKQALADVITPY
ncbi:MAG: TIGR01777 family oxidoreductase [Desulfovibrionaceae bacterium]|nr:TIGR01777 family oxidoreductase [Desulfovibrionaceae bacterium]